MDGELASADKRMRLRYASACRVCGLDLQANAEAIYERSTKTVRCLEHADPPPDTSRYLIADEVAAEPPLIESGTPGASARREFERRTARREERIRSQHPKLGGLILALSDDPQTARAWGVGAVGEERLGRRLNELTSETLRVLHDRRIPGTRANIDHIAVGPSGVYVIDAKKYKGRPHLTVEGGLLRPRVEKLIVGSRDCTKLVDGVVKQVEVIGSLIPGQVPIHGVLCFVEADWPLVGGTFQTRGVATLWPKKLYPKLTANGPLNPDAIVEIHALLASALPQA